MTLPAFIQLQRFTMDHQQNVKLTSIHLLPPPILLTVTISTQFVQQPPHQQHQQQQPHVGIVYSKQYK